MAIFVAQPSLPVGILSWTRDTNVVVNEENILVLLATCQTSHLSALRLGTDNASLSNSQVFSLLSLSLTAG